MKKELDLQLLQDVAFKEINGIKAKEILQLRNIRKEDTYEYYNKLKLKYITSLGFLGLEYKVNQEIEKAVFAYIDYLIHQLPAEKMADSNAQFNISHS